MPPQQAVARLIEGNKRFVARAGASGNGGGAPVAAAFPFAAIVACADSVAAPDLLFDQLPGSLFVLRSAGNGIDGGSLGGLEFAVELMTVSAIMVLGHTNCRIVESAAKAVSGNLALPDHLPALIASLAGLGRVYGQEAITANVVGQVEKLIRVLDRRIRVGELQVVGAVHDLASGEVTLL
ncbi:MAG: carbonic anhydrase [Micropruina sp.]|nr:carbonic anhydrase [Micropruina sp.]